MKILIIDDERSFLNTLRQTVARACAENGISAEIEVSENAEPLIQSGGRGWDLVLLDIEMPGRSGLELAARINELKNGGEKPYIIFVTNRDGLVFEALRLQPYSFVRKSHLEDLTPCLVRLNEKCPRDFITVKSGRGAEKIPLGELVYLEKQNNYIIFHTSRGEYRERGSMDERAEYLTSKGFVRPHISYLVSLGHIAELTPQTVRLTDGTQLPLSRKHGKEVKQKFFEWMVGAQ